MAIAGRSKPRPGAIAAVRHPAEWRGRRGVSDTSPANGRPHGAFGRGDSPPQTWTVRDERSGRWRALPRAGRVVMRDDRPLGVWMVGARGAVATTTVVGTAALRRGLLEPIGMVTEAEPLRGLPLAGLDTLAFGGHDVSLRPLPTRRSPSPGTAAPAPGAGVPRSRTICARWTRGCGRRPSAPPAAPSAPSCARCRTIWRRSRTTPAPAAR